MRSNVGASNNYGVPGIRAIFTGLHTVFHVHLVFVFLAGDDGNDRLLALGWELRIVNPKALRALEDLGRHIFSVSCGDFLVLMEARVMEEGFEREMQCENREVRWEMGEMGEK